MKAFCSLFLTGLLLVTLPGCSLRMPGLAVDIGDTKGGPPHCPPGQAKKGRC